MLGCRSVDCDDVLAGIKSRFVWRFDASFACRLRIHTAVNRHAQLEKVCVLYSCLLLVFVSNTNVFMARHLKLPTRWRYPFLVRSTAYLENC